MDFLGKLLLLLDSRMPVPKMYGWFHIAFFLASIIIGIFLCKRYKNAEETTVRKVLLIAALISIVLEIYKQINYTFSYDGTAFTADYQWYAFPFQFCSTPMYISLLAALLPNKKLHSALSAYLASFALFAGLCVMFYPAQVFIEVIGINIQTMICHGSMVTVGIFLLGTNYVEPTRKSLIKSCSVFAVLVFLAAIMNEIAYFSGLLETETFNMFFISPHCEPSLPVYSLVQQVVPFPWCTIIYIVAFSLAAYIILLLAGLIKKLCLKTSAKPSTQTQKDEALIK